MPKVTLYITNHNYAKYLKKAIDSAVQQTYDDLEILIIDDGSEDGSRGIIEKYRGIENISIYYNEHQGLTRTANFAIKHATGDLIMRLDADDYLERNAVEVLVDYFSKHNNIAAVFPGYYVTDSNENIRQAINRKHQAYFLQPDDKEPHGACLLIRKSVFSEVGHYNEVNCCRDGYDFWLKMRHKYRILAIPEFLFYYRKHGKNLTSNHKTIDEANEIIRANAL